VLFEAMIGPVIMLSARSPVDWRNFWSCDDGARRRSTQPAMLPHTVLNCEARRCGEVRIIDTRRAKRRRFMLMRLRNSVFPLLLLRRQIATRGSAIFGYRCCRARRNDGTQRSRVTIVSCGRLNSPDSSGRTRGISLSKR